MSLIIAGSWKYIKGKTALNKLIATSGDYPEEKEVVFKASVLFITGSVGIFIVIYHFNKPPKKKFLPADINTNNIIQF